MATKGAGDEAGRKRKLVVALPFVPDGPEMMERPVERCPASPDEAGSRSSSSQPPAPTLSAKAGEPIPPLPFTKGSYSSMEEARRAINALSQPLGFEVTMSSVKDGKYATLVCHRRGTSGAYGHNGSKRPKSSKATGCPFKVNCSFKHPNWIAKQGVNEHNHPAQDASELPQLRKEKLAKYEDEVHRRLIVDNEQPRKVRKFLEQVDIAMPTRAFERVVAEARKKAKQAPKPAEEDPLIEFKTNHRAGILNTICIPASVVRALGEEYGYTVAVDADHKFKRWKKPRQCGYCKAEGHSVINCPSHPRDKKDQSAHESDSGGSQANKSPAGQTTTAPRDQPAPRNSKGQVITENVAILEQEYLSMMEEQPLPNA